MARFDPFKTAADLVDCVCAVLKSPDRPEADRWAGDCCVWPGGGRVPSQQCCDGKGQLSVRVQNGYPTNSFPAQTVSAPECGSGTLSMATVYELKSTRCVGADPMDCDCTCKETNAARLLGDLQAILQGINCCFEPSDADDCTRYVLNSWQLLEPSGGCSGVVVSVTVESDGLCCPPEE